MKCFSSVIIIALLLLLLDGLGLSCAQTEINKTEGEAAILRQQLAGDLVKLEWQDGIIVIGRLEDGKIYLPPVEKFRNRLQLLLDGTLQIDKLKEEDSGTYTAVMTFKKRDAEHHDFILHVSERSSGYSTSIQSGSSVILDSFLAFRIIAYLQY